MSSTSITLETVSFSARQSPDPYEGVEVTLDQVDVEKLLDEVVGGDIADEVFKYIARNYPQGYIMGYFGERSSLFTCPKCRLTLDVERMSTNDEVCLECLCSEMEKESKL